MSMSSAYFEDDPARSNPASWMKAALSAAAAIGSIAIASAAYCEEVEEPGKAGPQLQRFASASRLGKDGLRDPSTKFATNATEREVKQHEAASDGATAAAAATPLAPSIATVLATSAVDAPPQNPADYTADAAAAAAAVATHPAAAAADGKNGSAAVVLPVDMSAVTVGEPLMSLAEARIEEATRKAKQHSGGLKVFSGNGNMSLALEICRHLGVNLGKATVGKFADGEVNVVIHENVRGKDVYVVQPTCPPVNDNMMELLLMVSTLRRSSARRITVVIPYYGYARQDRKMQVSAFWWLSPRRWFRFPTDPHSFRLSRPLCTRLASPLVPRTLHVSWKPWESTVLSPSICIAAKSKDSLGPGFPLTTLTAE